MVEECLILCVLGVLCGYGLSAAVKQILSVAHPTLTIMITPRWMLQAACLAVVGGLLGALYPAWRAARVDPVKALQYE